MKKLYLLLTFLLLLINCTKKIHQLTDEQTSWVEYNRVWKIDDIYTPFDKFKLIGIYEIPERVVDGNLIPLKYVVEWGWYVLVRNKSERTKKIDISYHLLDKDGFEISNSIKIDNWVYGLNPNRKKPESYLDFDSLTFLGNKNIIQGTGTFDYKYLDRIGKSKYEIKLTY